MCAQLCPTCCNPTDCSPAGPSLWDFHSGLPFPTSGNLPNPGIEPESLASPALAGGFFTTVPPGNPISYIG